MGEVKPSTRCHCGGAHDPSAHMDLDAALRVADAAIVDGDTPTARAWLRVVARVARRAA